MQESANSSPTPRADSAAKPIHLCQSNSVAKQCTFFMAKSAFEGSVWFHTLVPSLSCRVVSKKPPRDFPAAPRQNTHVSAANELNKKDKKYKQKKPYSSRCSLVVTDPTTNLPISSLTSAEQTGSLRAKNFFEQTMSRYFSVPALHWYFWGSVYPHTCHLYTAEFTARASLKSGRQTRLAHRRGSLSSEQ